MSACHRCTLYQNWGLLSQKKKGTFVCITSMRTLPPLQNFEVRPLVPHLNPKNFASYPLIRKFRKNQPLFCKGDEGMLTLDSEYDIMLHRETTCN